MLDPVQRTCPQNSDTNGQRVYEAHRQNGQSPLKLAKPHDFVVYTERQMLEEKLIPDTICGKVRRGKRFATTVCAKMLYYYIDQCLVRVRNIDFLLTVKRKSQKNGHPEHKRSFGMSIDERPDAVNNRERFGHWEINTVIGKQEASAVLLTIDERTTQYRPI